MLRENQKIYNTLVANLDKITAETKAGKTINEFCKEYGCSRTFFYKFRKEFGIESEQRGPNLAEGTKLCKTCRSTLPLDRFYSNGYTEAGKKKYKPSCKSCEADNKIEEHRRRIKSILEAAGRQFACELCGYDKNYAVLQFHHIEPKKKNFAISSAKSRSYEDLKKEIGLCAILCANCHTELHNPNAFKNF
jgi:hypothetical protein